MVVKYLTPSTLKKLPALLKEGIKNPKTGDVCQVNYAWSETEPSTGGGAVKMVYQKVTSIDAEGGNYVIVVRRRTILGFLSVSSKTRIRRMVIWRVNR